MKKLDEQWVVSNDTQAGLPLTKLLDVRATTAKG
jgi:hypothetical protein